MPKILQKTLLTSIINYTGGILLYYIIFAIVNPITNNNYNFWEDRDMALFFFIISFEFFDISIPDYIFIAPFSRKERIKLQKKLFLYNHFATWIITSAFIAFPELIESAINKNLYGFGIYIFEIAVIYFLLFTSGHFRYFNMLNKRDFKATGIFTAILILTDSSVMAAIITEPRPGNYNFIIMGVTGIVAILASLYCYKKHFKNMLEFYSDYETRIQQKT